MSPSPCDRLVNIRQVLVVGGGTMGQQIACHCLAHGLNVRIHDVNPDALKTAQAVKFLNASVFQSRLADRIGGLIASLTVETDPTRAARDVDLLIEAVPERASLKRIVFEQFGALCRPEAIFTTNTSTMLPSMLAAASGRPAQFAAMHFGLQGELVEIMPTPLTSSETIQSLQEFARSIHHLPIVCRKEVPGYVLNTMLMSLNAAALRLVVDGVASVEDIDRAWMRTMDVGIGPFGILDGVGLDTAWSITEFRAKLHKEPETQRIADFLKTFVDQGRLGVKSGAGFYTYPQPAYKAQDFLAPGRD